MINLESFCSEISDLNFDNTWKALAILYFLDEEQKQQIPRTSGQLAKIIFSNGLGNPNSTSLKSNLKKSKHVLTKPNGFILKAKSKSEISKILSGILENKVSEIDQKNGFIPKNLWKNTRGYIEKVCSQLNGCYFYAFYDGASVLLRRLVETLIIETYEKLNRENEIKDSSGNYYFLADLIDVSLKPSGLNLGRETKKALKKIKMLGDRSAHNRRYNAIINDLNNVRDETRITIEELLYLSQLKK